MKKSEKQQQQKSLEEHISGILLGSKIPILQIEAPRKYFNYPKRDDFTITSKWRNTKIAVFLLGKKLTDREKLIERIKKVTYYNTDIEYKQYHEIDSILVKFVKYVKNLINSFEAKKKLKYRKDVLKMVDFVDTYLKNHSFKYIRKRMYELGMTSEKDKEFWYNRDEEEIS